MLQLHLRMELIAPLVALIAACIATVVTDAGNSVTRSYMPTIAQILPVLFLAQIVESGFFAQRAAAEIPAGKKELARRYLLITGWCTLLLFLPGEAAALLGVACGPTTFLVAYSALVGAIQAIDLALGLPIRAGNPLAVVKMAKMTQEPDH